MLATPRIGLHGPCGIVLGVEGGIARVLLYDADTATRCEVSVGALQLT